MPDDNKPLTIEVQGQQEYLRRLLEAGEILDPVAVTVEELNYIHAKKLAHELRGLHSAEKQIRERIANHPLSSADSLARNTDAVAATPATFPKRAAWLLGQLQERKWTVHKLEAHGGPSWKTGRKILEGKPVSQVALEKTVQALSTKKPVVTLQDIPTD